MATTKIAIRDQKNGFLTFDLNEVLSALPFIARSLEWYLLEIEGTGNGLNGESILQTESRAASSINGLSLTFAELTTFAQGIQQTINGVIVGISAGDNRPSLPLRLTYRSPYIAIEAIDSSEWIVTSSEAEVIKAISHRFADTSIRAG